MNDRSWKYTFWRHGMDITDHVITFLWHLLTITLFQKCLHDPTFLSCCKERLHLSLGSCLKDGIWKWWQFSMEHLFIRWNISKWARTGQDSHSFPGKCQLATKGILYLLILVLVCIYAAKIGVSYSEAKKKQNLNASGVFWWIRTWNFHVVYLHLSFYRI